VGDPLHTAAPIYQQQKPPSTRRSTHSIAIDLDIWTTPAFEALQCTYISPRLTITPAIEAMVTIEPPCPCASIARA
jgi:hypothetical protein